MFWTDASVLAWLRTSCSLTLLCLLLLVCRGAARNLAVVFVVVGGLLLQLDGPRNLWSAISAGMSVVTPVVALLVLVGWLGHLMLSGRYNMAIVHVVGTKWPALMGSLYLPAILAMALSPFILAGGIVQSYLPFHQVGAEKDNYAIISVVSRGVTVGLLWSPLSPPVALCITALKVSPAGYLSISLPLAAASCIMQLLNIRRWPRGQERRPRGVAAGEPAPPDPLRRALAAVCFLLAVPVAVIALGMLRHSFSIGLVLTVLATVASLWTLANRWIIGPEPISASVRIPSGNVAVFLSLGILTAGVSSSSFPTRVMDEFGNVAIGWPIVTIPIMVYLSAALLFMVGVHPVAVVAIMLPLGAVGGLISPPLLALGIVAGAQTTSCASPFSGLSVLSSIASGFEVETISLKANWRFSLAQSPLLISGIAVAALVIGR